MQYGSFACYPLQFSLPVSLSGEYLAGLSVGAALWGRHHGLLSFEDLVSYCRTKQGTGCEAMEALAGVSKDEYSEKGVQLVRQLEAAHICDTVEAHQRYADEAISAVYACVLSQRRSFPNVARRVICSIAGEIDCVCEEEWTGDPETPCYLNDHGFSPAWASRISSARYILRQADGFTMRLRSLFSRRNRCEATWEKIEELLVPGKAGKPTPFFWRDECGG